MLPFRSPRTSSRRPAGAMGANLQRKGTWLVMALLVFVVLVGQSAWRKQKANNPAPNDGHMVDNRVEPGKQVAQADQPDPAAKPIMPGDLKLPDAKPLVDGETKHYFGNISSKLFAEVNDDAPLHKDEVAPLFKLLDILGKSDERDIELASVGRKTFVQLFEQSNVYRGDIVTVGGTVMRITPQTNPPPYPKQYEVWIMPDGSRLPIVVSCLEIPKDYPAGTKPEIDASGYFFKRFGYPSAEKASGNAEQTGMTNVFRSSPMILTKTIKLRPKVVAAANPAEEDEGPAFLKGVRLPFPNKYALPVLGVGMVLLTFMSAWAYRISRTSVLAGGPIVSRHRKDEPPAEVKNLNTLNLEP